MANRQITYCEAIREATHQCMEADPNVFVYGIGGPDHVKIFGTTAGLVEAFGPERCFDTPVAEESMVGMGLGAALGGLRPVHMHIRADFLLLAMNQIANMVSNLTYVNDGQLKIPLVIRAVIGRGWGQGCQHSKSVHGLLSHFPGLKVIVPTTPSDAKGLLTEAIRDDNPVMCMEHRWLYWQTGEVAREPFTIPFGVANVLRAGVHVTVIAISWMNTEATKAAEILERRGVSLEIIDPRSLVPLDEDTIMESVRRTRRCIIADVDWLNCGFSAELAARIGEQCFGELDCPIQRIGFAPVPCPTVRHMENEFYANAIDIIRAVEGMVGISPTDLTGEEFYSHEKRFKGPF